MGEITSADVPPSICERLLDVLVEFGVHAAPPRGIKPPRMVVGLYEAAAAHYDPVIGLVVDQLCEARTFLASIASAQAQGTAEQSEWMIAQAREGLRRAGGHDYPGVYPQRVPPATPEQSTEAMRLSADRAALPPELLNLIRDPRLSIPGDPLAASRDKEQNDG